MGYREHNRIGWILLCGADAPETFLAYAGFDGTEARKDGVPLKTYGPHMKDWREGDPTWKGSRGKGIIGAVNCLAGKPWVVANDEQNPHTHGVPPDPGYQGTRGDEAGYTIHDVRRQTLWGNLMAGGAGVEYYFGNQLPEGDQTCQDYRSRDRSWDFGRIALTFFDDNDVPFQAMGNHNELLAAGDGWCLAAPGQVYVLYLPGGGDGAELDLENFDGEYSVRWYDPRRGGALQSGSEKTVRGPGRQSIGRPPDEPEEDWAILIR